MICAACKHPTTEVLYTRQDEDTNETKRCRHCLKCGLRFITHEQISEKSIKRDNRINGVTRAD